ncbi:hypothetical protein K461DRAFT_40137 [Myriangium duriaei CBS 260.36]|uniref:Uncharacterized protein n=1 Tax=Myriangium duriaei CBS 260.36 TaxID=1168546 RepID=A0A9P4J0F3_9PEZI|nr:hypothetical protein K461DRAFT_40137 [Myriangium duriaei CBS 260.36]
MMYWKSRLTTDHIRRCSLLSRRDMSYDRIILSPIPSVCQQNGANTVVADPAASEPLGLLASLLRLQCCIILYFHASLFLCSLSRG